MPRWYFGIELPTQAHMNERRAEFTALLRRAQSRSDRSIRATADLAGVSASYLSELLAGRRHLVRWHRLRALCELGWELSYTSSIRIFECRIRLDLDLRPGLPPEFFWRLGAFTDATLIAIRVGINYSTLFRFLSGTHIPEFAVTLRICRCLSFNIQTARKIHLTMLEHAVLGPRDLLMNDLNSVRHDH